VEDEQDVSPAAELLERDPLVLARDEVEEITLA